jgi:hypothetical protein
MTAGSPRTGWPPRYSARSTAAAIDQAAARLYDWTMTCIDSHVPELRRLAGTLTTYFSTGRIGNGLTARG